MLSAGAHGTPSGPPSFTLGLAVCGMCRQVVAAVSHVSGVESVDVPRGHGVSLSPRPPSRVTAHLFARRHSTPTPTPFSRLHGNLLLEWIVASSFLPASPPPQLTCFFFDVCVQGVQRAQQRPQVRALQNDLNRRRQQNMSILNLQEVTLNKNTNESSPLLPL